MHSTELWVDTLVGMKKRKSTENFEILRVNPRTLPKQLGIEGQPQQKTIGSGVFSEG